MSDLICAFCEKKCLNPNSLRNHQRLCKSNPSHQVTNMESAMLAAKEKIECVFCKKQIALHSIKKHEKGCRSNPINQKSCPVCKTMHGKSGVTCSYSCSNTYFRSGVNNPNWKEESYRTTCWNYHQQKCIVCGEEKIVAVHHVNENHNDNRPENLVPLCPTHHQYVHSRYKEEVQPIIDDYVKKFILGFA